MYLKIYKLCISEFTPGLVLNKCVPRIQFSVLFACIILNILMSALSLQDTKIKVVLIFRPGNHCYHFKSFHSVKYKGFGITLEMHNRSIHFWLHLYQCVSIKVHDWRDYWCRYCCNFRITWSRSQFKGCSLLYIKTATFLYGVRCLKIDSTWIKELKQNRKK